MRSRKKKKKTKEDDKEKEKPAMPLAEKSSLIKGLMIVHIGYDFIEYKEIADPFELQVNLIKALKY